MYNNGTRQVELSSKVPDSLNADSFRIGARLVIDLLRLQAEEPPTDKIRLTPSQTKPALAMLGDRLLKLQFQVVKNGVECSVSQALADNCSELQIPLPISEPDWGAVGLLDQLFDQLLAQRGLDEEACNWLQQLRLPVLRYALLDYSFFFTPQNLVRRFLNQAYLILLSSTEKSRSVYREKLNEFISRVLNEFSSDAGDMNSICIDAQAWFAGQNQRVEKIEEQLKVMETARHKENVAEQRVIDELNRVAAGKVLPDMVVDFLHGEWRKSLLLVSMHEGEAGPTWKRQIRITESIVEFSLNCIANEGNDPEKFRSFYPVLIKNIRALLKSVGDDAEALEIALEPLELSLSAMLNGAVPPLVEATQLELTKTYVSSIEVKRVSQHARERIEDLNEGDWLRMRTSDGRYELCRVVLKGVDDAPWVLVSQSGKTVAKKNLVQLAQAFEGGVLDVDTQTSFWETALNTQLNLLHTKFIADQKARQQEAAQKKKAEVEAQAQLKVEVKPDTPVLKGEDGESLIYDKGESQSDTKLPGLDLSLESAELDSESKTLPELEQDTDDLEGFLTPRPISEHEMAAALHAVEQIQVGGWIAQQTSTGEQRCKLAVKIQGRDKLIFVNRVGIKILEIEKPDLARLMVNGAVTILDTGAAFDSTLERVVRSIQKDKR